MSRVPFVVGNWKMHTGRGEAVALARAMTDGAPSDVELAVCPPFPWLVPVADALRGTAVAIGAQNCWTESAGAFTGEVSPTMLRELCQYVIVGHSERRSLLGETDELIARKVAATLEVDLHPILCVGESLETRRAGAAEHFVREQLQRALLQRTREELARCTIAYEPIWAIGTGIAAEPDDAAQMAAAVRIVLHDLAGGAADSMRILYGGSVNAENAKRILDGEHVDGALVGGASLNAAAFLAIARAARD